MNKIKTVSLLVLPLMLSGCLIVMPGTVKDINNYWLTDNCEVGKNCPVKPEDCNSRTGDAKARCLEFVKNKEETKGSFINH